MRQHHVPTEKELDRWYRFNEFPDNYFDFCLDIGARHGEVAKFMIKRNPNAKIICYEPCIENYDALCKNMSGCDNVVCVNEALGNGNDLYYSDEGRSDMHMFVPEDIGTYKVKSVMLEDIFKLHQVHGKIHVVIDAEGGEWCLLNGQALLQCEAASIELHFKPLDPTKTIRYARFPDWAIFNEWIYKTLADTYSVIYHDSSRYRGGGIFSIKRK